MLPTLASAVVEQTSKAPTPSGGTSGATAKSPTPLAAPTKAQSAQGGGNPRQPLKVELPMGAAKGSAGAPGLDPLASLMGGGKGAK